MAFPVCHCLELHRPDSHSASHGPSNQSGAQAGSCWLDTGRRVGSIILAQPPATRFRIGISKALLIVDCALGRRPDIGQRSEKSALKAGNILSTKGQLSAEGRSLVRHLESFSH